jgi:5-hydroxyisourate hydrolase-like protein (transthyretin family)
LRFLHAGVERTTLYCKIHDFLKREVCMPGKRWIPLVAATALIAAGAGYLCLVPPGGQARAATLAPEHAAGFQTTEKLLLTLSLNGPEGKKVSGDLHVQIVGPENQIVAEQKKPVELQGSDSFRFEFPPPKTPVQQLKLRCAFGKDNFEVDLPKILLVKAHETSLSAGQEFHAGSSTSLRCTVQGVKSSTESVPLPGATVEVKLTAKDGKTHTLYSGKTGADGVAPVEIKLPDIPSGNYKMEVATRSTLGEEKLEKEIKVKNDPKLLLVTDKPLYQPGQVIHIRALALQSFSLDPVAKSDLLFEVEDAKGNKVFKRTLPTSEYGIAAIDFQLADEVNQGDYRIRAAIGQHQTDKTVTVKPYVLPKFKNELKADKQFYLPKETIKADLQCDYFFGKPIARGKVTVKASTFDVAFKDFETWKGDTDEQGHVKFEIKLPDYFVGQPLEKGNALVKLEVKVTDSADHSETITRTYTVANQPIRVNLIPEGGRLVPSMENKVFAAALYPDGSPAPNCEVSLWVGKEGKGKPFETVKTNDAGLAEFRIYPKSEQFRQGEWAQRKIEMLGGNAPQVFAPQSLFDLYAEAKDAKGATAKATVTLNGEPFGENVILRLDKAVYKGGDTIKFDIRSSAGVPTVYVDVVRQKQTMLTRWFDVKDGQAKYELNLPPEVFGTLEVHAYQTLSTGEIIRDARVVYVQPASDLKIDVKADKDVYLPGAEGKIQFQVTDAKGKPTPAALGVIIVDEAVYALQEMQPGLEKVYFTLQEELMKPQAQAVFKPGVTVDNLIVKPELAANQQQMAEVLLTAVKPQPPARWEVDPAQERRRKLDSVVAQVGYALFQYAQGKETTTYDKDAKTWRWKKNLLDELVKGGHLAKENAKDPTGAELSLDGLAQFEKDFTPEKLGRALTLQHMQTLMWQIHNHSNGHPDWFKDQKWSFPDTMMADIAKAHNNPPWMKDGWGNAIKLVKLDKKRDNKTGMNQFDFHTLVSAGPDGKFDTADDVTLTPALTNENVTVWWIDGDSRHAQQSQFAHRQLLRRQIMDQMLFERGAAKDMARFGMPGGPPGGRNGFPLPLGAPGLPMPVNAGAPGKPSAAPTGGAPMPDTGGAPGQGAAAGPPIRLREYFPETMLWQPALITDEKGRALLPVPFADSITTWRLTASASSKGGLLGGVTAPLRVFQDFFVDLDLPLNLTQNDEIAFPVAVYNYLKDPQTVRLDLKQEPWFELTEGDLTRSLDLKPGEVTSIKFRIRAKRIGHFPLTVEARGTKMSDAIKRSIEVVPDGQKVEQVATDRLSGKVTQTVTIPDNAIPDASKLLVKVYPGVFSQVLEGTEGLLRLPGG